VALDPVPGTNILSVPVLIPASLPNDGRSFNVTVRAQDAAGHESLSASRSLALEDLAAPTVVAVSPFSGQSNVRVTTAVLVTFDRELDRGRWTKPFTVLEGGPHQLQARARSGKRPHARFTPSEPLRFATSYTVSTTAGLRAQWCRGEPGQTFTVTPFVIVNRHHSTVVEGQLVRFQADGRNETGIGSVVFVLPTAQSSPHHPTSRQIYPFPPSPPLDRRRTSSAPARWSWA
jgi:hypothetical protein